MWRGAGARRRCRAAQFAQAPAALPGERALVHCFGHLRCLSWFGSRLWRRHSTSTHPHLRCPSPLPTGRRASASPRPPAWTPTRAWCTSSLLRGPPRRSGASRTQVRRCWGGSAVHVVWGEGRILALKLDATAGSTRMCSYPCGRYVKGRGRMTAFASFKLLQAARFASIISQCGRVYLHHAPTILLLNPTHCSPYCPRPEAAQAPPCGGAGHTADAMLH